VIETVVGLILIGIVLFVLYRYRGDIRRWIRGDNSTSFALRQHVRLLNFIVFNEIQLFFLILLFLNLRTTLLQLFSYGRCQSPRRALYRYGTGRTTVLLIFGYRFSAVCQKLNKQNRSLTILVYILFLVRNVDNFSITCKGGEIGKTPSF